MTTAEIEKRLKRYYPEAFSEPDTLGFRLLQFGIEMYNCGIEVSKKTVEQHFQEKIEDIIKNPITYP
jgi:hypothetical protein